ncbi:MAG: hypothetical protein IPK72_21165 [Candidatus Eisenbacteria bacterium]|nr:hypothetical protein [Candidatus Eisenbacteria bacterium]
MTRLKRPLARTSETRLPSGRAVVIELSPPNIITLREAGRRRRVSISAEGLYTLLLKREEDAARAARKRKRNPRAVSEW